MGLAAGAVCCRGEYFARSSKLGVVGVVFFLLFRCLRSVGNCIVFSVAGQVHQCRGKKGCSSSYPSVFSPLASLSVKGI